MPTKYKDTAHTMTIKYKDNKHTMTIKYIDNKHTMTIKYKDTQAIRHTGTAAYVQWRPGNRTTYGTD